MIVDDQTYDLSGQTCRDRGDAKTVGWRRKELLALGLSPDEAIEFGDVCDSVHSFEHLIGDLHCPKDLAVRILR